MDIFSNFSLLKETKIHPNLLFTGEMAAEDDRKKMETSFRRQGKLWFLILNFSF